ncbi:MAG TPA: hypothetical protein VGZ03_08600 [Acidimicrobiales bacterium]|jgi:hypothetical protein|nr:hypothetical protein [Acidimicrobiales bacterium]
MASWRSTALPLRIGVAALAVAAATLPTIGAGASAKAAPVPQRGINTYVQDLCQSSKVWANDAKGQFGVFKSLGANSVALAFPLYTYSVTSNAVFGRTTCGSVYQTPSPGRLAVLIKAAHALHLRVFLRPLLDETVLQKQGGWRGSIKPSNTHLWFKSYLSTLTPYLKLAQQNRVEYFSVATELDSMATKSNWTSLISSVKRLYRGRLSFTINWAETASGKVGWAGTSPGMDTYQSAALPNNATPSDLLTAWNNALSSSDKVPFSLAAASIDEIAILAQDGAYSQPWAWSLPLSTHPFDQSIQANWYSMACTFYKSHNMQGIYFWGVWFADGSHALPKGPDSSRTQEIQPASAAVIRHCFTGK